MLKIQHKYIILYAFLLFIIFIKYILFVVFICIINGNILTYKLVKQVPTTLKIKSNILSITYKAFHRLSSNYFIISLFSIYTSFMPPSWFLLPTMLFLCPHLTNSYLDFGSQIKRHLLYEAFAKSPPSGVPSIFLLSPQFSYEICIHSSLLVLLFS